MHMNKSSHTSACSFSNLSCKMYAYMHEYLYIYTYIYIHIYTCISAYVFSRFSLLLFQSLLPSRTYFPYDPLYAHYHSNDQSLLNFKRRTFTSASGNSLHVAKTSTVSIFQERGECLNFARSHLPRAIACTSQKQAQWVYFMKGECVLNFVRSHLPRAIA